MAASPGQSGYSAPAGKVQQEVRRHDPAGHEGGGGSLPFTGLDIVFVVGAGGVLTVLGLGVRRLTRRPGAVA